MDALVWYANASDPKELEENLNRSYAGALPNSAETIAAHPICVLHKPVSIVTNHITTRLDGDRDLILRINAALAKGRKDGTLPRLPLND